MSGEKSVSISEMVDNARKQHAEGELDEDVAPMVSNLPSQAEVVVPEMKKAVQKLFDEELEKEAEKAEKKGAKNSILANGATPNKNDYFTADHIAPALWAARKEAFGGKPWLEDALFLFAHSRAFEYESAAKRFFKFNKELKLTELQSLDEIPFDVAETLGNAGLYYLSPNIDAQGRPTVYVCMKNYDYVAGGYQLKQMQRMNMWLFWQWSTRFHPLPQINGLRFVLSFTNVTMGEPTEYRNWREKVSQEMLPCKVAAIVMVYPPWWLDSLLWPAIRLFMKQKILDRILWAGNKPEKVKAKYMFAAHRKVTGLFVQDPTKLEKFCKELKLNTNPPYDPIEPTHHHGGHNWWPFGQSDEKDKEEEEEKSKEGEKESSTTNDQPTEKEKPPEEEKKESSSESNGSGPAPAAVPAPGNYGAFFTRPLEKQAPTEELLLASIPIELGGTMDITPDLVQAHITELWKMSDEKIPEGCKCIPPKKK